MEKQAFTIEQGLKIQSADMSRWKKVLKKKYFEALQEIVNQKNVETTPRSGYDIFRGSDIACKVHNLTHL
jgi:hypothetical protein